MIKYNKYRIINMAEYETLNENNMDVWGTEVSDGYHTMSELYEHRHTLFAALCNVLALSKPTDKHWRVWKSKLHYDGSMYDGWFIAGITGNHGDMTYHIPLEWWDKFRVPEIDKAPEFKGYTSKDVMERLLKL